MKRIAGSFLAVLIALAIPSSLAAQEAAVDLQQSASYAGTENSPNYAVKGLSASTMLAPSFVLPMGSKAELRGLGYLKLNVPHSGSVKLLGYDIQLMQFTLALKNPRPGMDAFVLEAGRTDFADPTGYVVSSPVDAMSFQFSYPGASFTFAAAYTGLLFLDTSPFTISLADQARSSADTSILGSRRLLGSARLDLPRFFGQTLSLSALVQNDLNDRNEFVATGSTAFQAEKGGALNTQYFGFNLAGSISSLSYSCFFDYGSGRILSWLPDASSASLHSYQLAPISSFIAGYSLELPVASLDSSFGLKVLFASGDADATGPVEGNAAATYKRFTPLTRTTLGLVFSPYLANLVFIQASATAKDLLLPRLTSSLKFMSFLRPTAGPISEPGIKAGSTSAYLGSELDITFLYGFMSDLDVSCTVGAFLPGIDPAGAFDAGYAGSKLQTAGTLAITLHM
jgi:hypothetical protein